MQFDIDQWRAWAPGLDSAEDWRAWCAAPRRLVDAQQQPDVSFLPALQRRRLSRLARMMFHVAWPLAAGHPALPLVFVSRHGETPRTLAILTDLARGEPLSPTQFSLSVHNAIIGLWSILRQDTSEMTALAAEGDGLEQAVLDACGLLAEGVPAVLVVVVEEAPPALFEGHIEDVPFPYAVALRLTAGQAWRLTLDSVEGPRADWPHSLNLLRCLLGVQSSLRHHWKRRQWTWSRPQP